MDPVSRERAALDRVIASRTRERDRLAALVEGGKGDIDRHGIYAMHDSDRETAERELAVLLSRRAAMADA